MGNRTPYEIIFIDNNNTNKFTTVVYVAFWTHEAQSKEKIKLN